MRHVQATAHPEIDDELAYGARAILEDEEFEWRVRSEYR